MKTPTRILVTGGAGFIGVHTVGRLVADGATVLVVDDRRHACGEALPPNVEVEAADLNSPATPQTVARFKPDAILHLAAQGGVSRSVRDPAGDALVNVLGTVALLKASADAGCRRFVFASSGGAIYGRAARLPTPERTVAKPLSPYGAAKLAAEGYLGMFARTFGLRTLALRYSNVYGPFQDRLRRGRRRGQPARPHVQRYGRDQYRHRDCDHRPDGRERTGRGGRLRGPDRFRRRAAGGGARHGARHATRAKAAGMGALHLVARWPAPNLYELSGTGTARDGACHVHASRSRSHTRSRAARKIGMRRAPDRTPATRG